MMDNLHFIHFPLTSIDDLANLKGSGSAIIV